MLYSVHILAGPEGVFSWRWRTLASFPESYMSAGQSAGHRLLARIFEDCMASTHLASTKDSKSHAKGKA